MVKQLLMAGCQVFKFATQESQGALGIIQPNQSMPVSILK